MAEAREIVKKVANCIRYSDGTLRVDGVRLSYPHLDKPYAGPNDEGKQAKYGVVGMLPKSTHMDAKNLIKEAIEDMQRTYKAEVAKARWFLQNGDDSGKESYKGFFTISTRESNPPICRDRRGNVLTPDQIAKMFYGGCWANLFIRPWYQDGVKVGKGYGQRMNCGIIAVQFVRDDEPFGEGRINDDDVFDNIEGESGDGLNGSAESYDDI